MSHPFRKYRVEVDVQYLASLFASFLVALETFLIVHDASSSLLWGVVLALDAFCVAFTFFFVVAHRRKFALVRLYLLKRCRTNTAKRKAQLPRPQRPSFSLPTSAPSQTEE
jgi:hypothetical protein